MNTKPSFNIKLYDSIKDILIKPIDISKLPMVGEAQIYKMSAERYGHVVLKLTVGIESKDLLNFTTNWCVDENYSIPDTKRFDPNTLFPIEHEFYKAEVMNELAVFRDLFRSLNTDAPALRLDVIGGSLRIGERSYLNKAAGMAIVEIFKQLHQA